MSSSYHIKNLALGYSADKPIIAIKNLEIPLGKMIFIVGKSGVGKSTLLESLGLMTNTIIPQEGEQLSFAVDGQEIDILKLWENGGKEISNFRNETFSFIFQNTNLMPNFSIEENILMSSINQRPDIDKLKKEIADLLDQLQLPQDLLSHKAAHVSGGQRQRVAFIRALTKDFKILLADEPTGNLDFENSKILFRVLKKHLIEQGKTGIVVTHHPELADEFADMVLELYRTNDPKFGDIVHINSSIKTAAV